MKHLLMWAASIAMVALFALTTGPPNVDQGGAERFTGAAPIESIDATIANAYHATVGTLAVNEHGLNSYNINTVDDGNFILNTGPPMVASQAMVNPTTRMNSEVNGANSAGSSTVGVDALALKFFRSTTLAETMWRVNSTTSTNCAADNVLNCPQSPPPTPSIFFG